MQKIKNIYHLACTVWANLYHSFPGQKLNIIGVTGTDGKTTTTHLIYHILRSAGYNVSMISSVYAIIAGIQYDTGFHVTTPDAFALTKLLKKSLDAGDRYFVLETTSHALDQSRVYGINFELGVLTNITHEHLDYHKSYLNYLKTKTKLLLKSKSALINKDDESFLQVSQILQNSGHKFSTYSLKADSDYRLDLSKKLKLQLSLFNNYNYLTAYAASLLLGISKLQISNALKTFTLPPGRMELVYDRDYKVIIDFAHTPNAIYQALYEIKKRYIKGSGRIIHVFGSAAKRDITKRPLMGKSSGKFSDLVILTEEDYRNEDPKKICEEIAVGLKEMNFSYVASNEIQNAKNKSYTIVVDRSQAIQLSICLAKKGDVVVTTGKAHEESLCRGNKEYPWDERKAIMDAIKNRIKF